MTFSRIVAGAVSLFIGLLSFAGAAFAVQATATTTLNVRAGPGTGYSVVDTLSPGEIVDVGECAADGWCYIFQSGANGWVSSSYLTAAPASAGGTGSDCALSLTIGAGGTPTLSLTCGGGTPPATPAPAPAVTQACLYTSTNYTGAHFCFGVGTLNAMNVAFNDRISSVKVEGGAKVRLCVNNNLGGTCRTIVNNRPALGAAINNRASSLMVFTGLSPVPTPTPTPTPTLPVTFSTGLINLQQTFMANLDNGSTGAAGADIWYKAVTAVNKFITPRNGARLALGDGSNRGYAGCRTAAFSAAPISVWAMPVGTYVCVKTNAGRISQFRLNGYSGTTMRLGYTTWAN